MKCRRIRVIAAAVGISGLFVGLLIPSCMLTSLAWEYTKHQSGWFSLFMFLWLIASVGITLACFALMFTAPATYIKDNWPKRTP